MKIQAKIWFEGHLCYFKFRDKSYSFVNYNNKRHVSYSSGERYHFSESVNLRELNRYILSHVSIVKMLKHAEEQFEHSKTNLRKLAGIPNET
jgi:hypothetical protein